jgi:hypothetical protein
MEGGNRTRESPSAGRSAVNSAQACSYVKGMGVIERMT